jgi:hypothetical protein
MASRNRSALGENTYLALQAAIEHGNNLHALRKLATDTAEALGRRIEARLLLSAGDKVSPLLIQARSPASSPRDRMVNGGMEKNSATNRPTVYRKRFWPT